MTKNQTPAEFDVAAWLADGEDITTRAHETITLYKDVSAVEDAVQAVEDAERALRQATALEAKGARPGADAAIGEASAPDAAAVEAAVTAAQAHASEVIARTRLDVTVYALTSDEVDAAADGEDTAGMEGMCRVYAQSVRLPGGQSVDAATWRQIHKAVGQGQWARLFRTWQAVYVSDPAERVDAVFSQRS